MLWGAGGPNQRVHYIYPKHSKIGPCGEGDKNMNYNDEYLIVGDNVIIDNGIETDGWYYSSDDHDWHFNMWMMDRDHDYD